MDILEQFLSKKELFGSRCFGVESNDSDYDYLVTIDDYKFITKILEVVGIEYTEGLEYAEPALFTDANIKFTYNDKVINLLVYKDKYYQKAVQAKQYILELIRQGVMPRTRLKDREVRYAVVETIFYMVNIDV